MPVLSQRLCPAGSVPGTAHPRVCLLTCALRVFQHPHFPGGEGGRGAAPASPRGRAEQRQPPDARAGQVSGGAVQRRPPCPSPCAGACRAWPQSRSLSSAESSPFPPSSRKCLSGSVVSLFCSSKYRDTVCTLRARGASCRSRSSFLARPHALCCGCKSSALPEPWPSPVPALFA